MTTSTTSNLIETRHALPESERAIEAAILTTIGQHLAGFTGPLREAYDVMTEWTPIAEDVTLEAVDQDGINGWWVRPAGAPADRAILFLHGGAYALGSAKSYRGFASQMAVRTGVAAFVPDYPLAPEHPFPAAHDMSVAACRWLETQGFRRVALVGDSAGGALALAVAGAAEATSPDVAAIVVFSPWIDLTMSGASFLDPATHDPIFQRPILTGAAPRYLGTADPRDGRASPLYAIPDRLPPLVIQVGTDEFLLDDATGYAAAAAEKGGEVRLDIYEGLHHVFQRSTRELPSARRALGAAASFLSRHLEQLP